MMTMRGTHLLSLRDLSAEAITQILTTGAHLKMQQKMGQAPPLLPGKTLAMIFQKPSLRTRVSFETGMTQLGGHAIYLGPDDIALGQRETTEDIARVLSRYVDGIMARVFEHGLVEELAQFATVPVINGLSDFSHPCQALGDFLTILEKKGRIQGLKLAYIGDGNNVATSLAYGAAKLGLHAAFASPVGYELRADVVGEAQRAAAHTGARISVTNDLPEAAADADIVYTDVWASMGQEHEQDKRRQLFRGYQITLDVLNKANPEAIFMHCLPAHYGEEVTYEAAHDPRSVIYDQAENRMHAQKAVLALVM
jgi:ornithine carbamoyltransferase